MSRLQDTVSGRRVNDQVNGLLSDCTAHVVSVDLNADEPAEGINQQWTSGAPSPQTVT